MVTLSDILPRDHIVEQFRDADVDIIMIGYNIEELREIIINKTSRIVFISLMLKLLTHDDMKYYVDGKLYGYEPIDLITNNSSLIDILRILSTKYGSKLNKLVELSRITNIYIKDLDTIIRSNNLYGEICKRIVNDIKLNTLRTYASKHMYDFNPTYIKNNIQLYKHLINVPYKPDMDEERTVNKRVNIINITNTNNTDNTNNVIVSNIISNQHNIYVSEIDMMKKMYGIPFLKCNTKHIQTCYKKIIEGGITMTLLVAGRVNGTSDITFDEYYDDELIFLLWNGGKFRPYNIPDILSCISVDDNCIRLVDSDGNVIEDMQYISKIIKPRLEPYITDDIREIYGQIPKEDIDPNDVYPMLITILDVVDNIIKIKDIPKEIAEYCNTNRNQCKEYLYDMYHMALYFRRWKGPGHPLPYRRKDADDKSVNPEVTCSKLIHKYRQLLKNKDRTLLGFLDKCPCYKDNTLVPQYTSIRKLFIETINANECIRVASNRFLYTSHRVYTTMFGKLDCDIGRFENIDLVAPEEVR